MQSVLSTGRPQDLKATREGEADPGHSGHRLSWKGSGRDLWLLICAPETSRSPLSGRPEAGALATGTCVRHVLSRQRVCGAWLPCPRRQQPSGPWPRQGQVGRPSSSVCFHSGGSESGSGLHSQMDTSVFTVGCFQPGREQGLALFPQTPWAWACAWAWARACLSASAFKRRVDDRAEPQGREASAPPTVGRVPTVFLVFVTLAECECIYPSV